jgi:hypothetical protein
MMYGAREDRTGARAMNKPIQTNYFLKKLFYHAEKEKYEWLLHLFFTHSSTISPFNGHACFFFPSTLTLNRLKSSMALVCEQTVPTQQPSLVGEVSAKFYG